MYKTVKNSMLHTWKKALGVGVLLFFTVSLFGQTTYYSRTTGDWSVAATWSTASCGGAASVTVPTSTDHVVICSGNTISIITAGNIAIMNMTINVGGVFDDNNLGIITINGNLVVNGISTGRQDIIMTGSGVTIDGTGNITTRKDLRIQGATSILSTANISVNKKIILSAGAVVTNNGIATVSGSVEGGDAASEWINTAGSTARFGKNVLTTGKLTASANNNHVQYFKSGNQNIATPTSTYHDLSITGKGAKKMLGDLTIEGDLDIISGSLNCENYDINLEGNWTNAGTFTTGTGEVNFQGTGSQTITNTNINGETFYDLTFTRTAGSCDMTLSCDVACTNALNMTSGNINLGSNTLTLGTDLITEGTLTHTSGQIIGKFARYINIGSTGVNFLFPVGTCSDYNYAQLNHVDMMGAGGTLTVEFIESAPGNNGLSLNDGGTTIYNSFVDGYWDFTHSGFVTSDFTLDLAGNGFTGFGIDAATRILTRTGAAAAWTGEGTHVAAVNPVAKRSGLGTESAQYCFGDDTNCSAPGANPFISTDQSVCSSETGVTYAVTDIVGSTYAWSIIPAGAGTMNPAPAAGDASVTIDWGATGQTATVQVIESNACTESAPIQSIVTIHSIAPASITGTLSTPENTTGVGYSVTNTTGYTYDWTITGGTQASGGTTNSITVDWGAAGTGTVDVTADSGSCATSATTSISVNKYIIIESIAGTAWNLTSTWDCTCIPLSTDNVRINNTHSVTLVGDVTVDNLWIMAGGTLDAFTNNKKTTVNGDFYVSGTYNGDAKELKLRGINTWIDGTGTINIPNKELKIEIGNKTILSTAVLNISAGNFRYNTSGISVTNNGKISISTGELMERDGTNTWINAANSSLNVGDKLFGGAGVLIASATGNLVRYMGTVPQTVKMPSAGTYYNLTVDSSGVKTIGEGGATLIITNDFLVDNFAMAVLANPLDINGDLTVRGLVSPYSQLDVTTGNFTINLEGDWLVSSKHADPFIHQNGTVIFDGNGNQQINNGSTNDERFWNLTMAKPAGKINLTANTDIEIQGAYTFTQGIIEAESASETVIFMDNATTNGGSPDSYVDGKVQKLGDDAFTFPTGDAGTWARIAIGVPSGPDEFTAQYFKADFGSSGVTAPLVNASKLEYWILDRLGAQSATVELFWENATNSAIDDCADLTVGHWDGVSTWTEEVATASGSCSGAGSGSVITTGTVLSFSPFAFASRDAAVNPLPIELLFFDAELIEDVVQVNWTTASESNNDFFTIERSQDGLDFEFLTYLSGAGTTNSLRDYSYIDANPLYGTSYYRLKQTDYDGTSETFPMVAVTYEPEEDLAIVVYPNPTQGKFWVDVDGKEGDEVLVVLLDMLGKQHYSKVIILEDNGYTLAFDPRGKLSSGMYLIVGSSNNKLYSKKLVIR